MSNTLVPGNSLMPNQELVSTNGKWKLIMQTDGNLVLYRTETGFAEWSTKTNGQDVKGAFMQGDGNFVLYTFANKPVWDSKTYGKPGSYLILQDDGNLVIYQPNVAVWASGTNQP